MREIRGPRSELDALMERYSNIYVIISPPRCSSTAFARVFWEQPSIGYYTHEPFEITYYMGKELQHVIKKLKDPLNLEDVKKHTNGKSGKALVLKEMPYQVGNYFPILNEIASLPIMFLMRDPRLNISSRMDMKLEVGDNPIFPTVESGWELLSDLVQYARETNIPHIIVDSTDFRNHPVSIFSQVFSKLNLPFSEKMLKWQPADDLDLDNLGGKHSHLYRRVLHSKGLEPETHTAPPMSKFPVENGFRDHVAKCLRIYRNLRNAPERVKPEWIEETSHNYNGLLN